MSLLTLQALASRRAEHVLFSPLTSKVEPGDYVEVVGVNGAGKSTLLRTLAGLHQQFVGSFECAPFLFAGHRLGLDPLLTGVENLVWFCRLSSGEITSEEIHSALERVAVLSVSRRHVGQLSHGQQRRVVMAKWLLTDSPVWLLDEPLNALDQAGQDLLVEIIDEHCQEGGSVLCATHTPLAIKNKTTLQLSAQF